MTCYLSLSKYQNNHYVFLYRELSIDKLKSRNVDVCSIYIFHVVQQMEGNECGECFILWPVCYTEKR